MGALFSRPPALFKALLRGDSAATLRLLEAGTAPGVDPPALVFPGGSNFSVLHAAALGGCAAAIPGLVAAGAPLDACLSQLLAKQYQSLRRLLDACGHDPDCLDGCTALELAAWSGRASCVQQLLEHGANPTLGSSNGGALSAAVRWDRVDPTAGQQLLVPFVQHGVDPLAPVPGYYSASSLLAVCSSTTAALLLAQLEQQRAAGILQLDSTQRAAELVLGIVRSSNSEQHLPLVRHAIAALEQLLGMAGGGQLAAADAELLHTLLGRTVAAVQPAALEALLASRLPFDLTAPWHLMSWVFGAARSSAVATACMRLLHQAGAPLTAASLYAVIDQLSATGVTALLACETPAVDVSVPTASARGGRKGWSCPIHRALHNARTGGRTRKVARILEALWAAGFRPTVYRNVRLPAFLVLAWHAPVFAELDPLALYDAAHPQHAHLRYLFYYFPPPPPAVERLLFLARTGGAWSSATHHHWPPALKQAARTLLLCAASGSSAADGPQRVTRAAACRRPQRTPSEEARLLGSLPPDVLLHVVKLAAEPLSAWL